MNFRMLCVVMAILPSILLAQNNGRPMRGGGGFDKSFDTELQEMSQIIPQKFKVMDFYDVVTGRTMTYNLFCPEDWQEKSYPMVLFMPDASTVGKGPKYALTQGWGGMVWATEESQEKHPCIVLVPSFNGPQSVVNDQWQISEEVGMVPRLVDFIVNTYNVDIHRIYTTGQSMGGMISFYLDANYPNMFAASIFVSSQWDTAVLAPLAKQKFFYITSAADMKAAPKMKELGELLDSLGAKFGDVEFSAKLPLEEQNEIIEKMIQKDYTIYFVRFTPGTVLPGPSSNPGAEHMYGFDAAYKLSAVRDWLFNQSSEAD